MPLQGCPQALSWQPVAQSDGGKLTLNLPRHPEFCPQHVRPTLTEQLEEELCMASLFPGGGEPLSKYDRFMTRFKKVS